MNVKIDLMNELWRSKADISYTDTAYSLDFQVNTR